MPTSIATNFINFTRDSLATVTDSDGKIKWAPHNLLTNSENFDATAWFKNNVTVEENSIAAPNGTTTADRIKEITDTTVPSVIQNITAAGATITFSVFAKTAQRSAIYLRLYNNTNVWEAAVFDLNAGTNPQNASGSATTFTNRTQAITPIGGGWNLCSITATFPSSAVGCNIHISNISSGITFNFSGDYAYATNAANGVYLWGAHLYRSNLGGMQSNGSSYPMYNPTTPKNLFGYTEDFTWAGWQKGNIAAFGSGSISNAIIAPNGLQTADKVVANTTNGEHYIYQTVTGSSKNTFSIYLKAAEYYLARIIELGTYKFYATVNLLTGTITNSGGTNLTFAGATDVGNGWWRCEIEHSSSAACAYSVIGFPNTIDPPNYPANYAGDGTSGIYVWGAQLSDSASLDPYVPNHFAAPTSAAYHGPRLDYDPVTLASKGMLVEEFRTNLLLQSSAFDSADWFLANATAPPNVAATLAPDGTNTANKLAEDTGTGVHRVLPIGALTVVSGTTYSYSVYAKAAERTKIYITDNVIQGATFDLSAGTVSGLGSGVTAPPPVPVGNGWYRCVITRASSNTAGRICIFLVDGAGSTSYAGVSGNGVYLWGAQVEVGAFATSYIPTGASAVDRNADVANVSTQAFPYSANEGTLLAYADWTNAAVATLIYQRIAMMGSPGDPYARSIQRQDTSATGVGLFYRGMFTGVNIATSGNSAKIGLAWSSTGGSGSVNGSAASSLTGTPTSSDGLPINILRIGNANDGTFFNGHIRSISYVPKRLTNLELQKRST